MDDAPFEAPDTAEAPEPAPAPAVAPSTRPRWLPLAMVGGLIVVVFLVASQVYLVTSLNDTQNTLAETQSALEETQDHVDDVDTQVAAVGSTVERLADQVASGTPAPSAQAAPQVPEGSLPQYVGGQPDTALGMQLGAVAGADAHTGEQLSIDPADGRKRVWMVWAHWCPYCQQELPELAAEYDDLIATYPDIEITTISTSIDPSRGNPLDAYLAANDFPFPIVNDPGLEVAAQMGVNAFPFWLVTDGDGTVLFRNAGYLSTDQFLNLFVSLDQYEA